MSSQTSRSTRWYPNGTTSSTFNVYFVARVTEDVGAFQGLQNMVSGATTLTVIYATGRDEGVTCDAIVDSIVQHLLNAGVAGWYSPPNGLSVETALRSAFESWEGPYQPGSASVTVYFNGQFGRVHVSV